MPARGRRAVDDDERVAAAGRCTGTITPVDVSLCGYA